MDVLTGVVSAVLVGTGIAGLIVLGASWAVGRPYGQNGRLSVTVALWMTVVVVLGVIGIGLARHVPDVISLT